MAQGVGFSIDASFLNKIEEADKKMKKLAETTENASQRMIAALKNVGTQGLDYLINEINRANEAMSKIGTTNKAANAVDSINKLSNALNNQNKQQGNDIFSFIENKLKRLPQVNNEISNAVNELGKLQEKLRFYKDGNEKKAGFGALDAPKIQKEADFLMGYITLLEKEKTTLEALKQTYITLKRGNTLFQESLDKQKGVSFDAQKQKKDLDNLNEAYRTGTSELQKKAKAEDDNNKAAVTSLQQQLKAWTKWADDIIKISNQVNKQVQADIQRTTRKTIADAYSNRKKDTSNQVSLAFDRMYSDIGNRSIQNMVKLIRHLQDAQKKLNLNTDEGKRKYDELGSKIRRIKTDIDNATGASNQLRNSHNSLINTGDQLMRKFALIFSVSQIQGYIDKLVQVRGEFELQQRAFQAILQNKHEANKIWQQTVDLAVRSPFRVGELVKYTKQLAAYRIETDQLHETTKRLADVSAGLGVDMNRLILAYGQVRAAEYLRGTELRQFTEAGIPMLEELAKHFTELEGRAVSTADVFSMISKRMVSFEDVAAVFQKMTDAGGVFYNMQEIQAETLKGQISNLHDSIDLMLNDIGKANDGVLKSGVQVAKFFVENWESVVNVMKGVIAALIGLKLHQLAAKTSIIQTALSMQIVTNVSTEQLTALQLLQVGWNKLTGAVAGAGAALKSVVAFNAPLLAITAIIGGIVELISTSNEHKKQIAEINKEYDDLLSKSNRVTVNFRYATTGGNFDKQKAELMQLVNIANNDYNMNIHIDLEGLSKEDIEEKFGELRNQILQLNAFQREFKLKLQQASEWTIQDDVTEDLQQYGNAATALMNNFHNNIHDIVYNLQQNFEELSESEKEALAILEEPIKPDESELDYLERVRGAYDKLLKKNFELLEAKRKNNTLSNAKALKEERKRLDDLGVGYYNVAKLILDYDKKLEEAEKEFNNFINTIDINERLPKDKKELLVKAAIDEQGWNEFTTEIAYRLANQKWSLEISVNEKPKEEDWEKWQKEYNEYIKTLEGKLSDATPESERFTLAKQLSDQYQEYNKIIKAYKAGAKEISKEEFAYAEQMAKSFNLAYKWLTGENIKEKGAKKGKGKDWWLEMIKGIQSLHKEFISLNKDLDDTNAKALAIDKHKTLFEEIKSHLGASANVIDISQIDLTDENAFEKFLKSLKEIKSLSAEARLAIEKALTDIKGEATVNIAIEETDSIKRAISDMFGNYELSLELEKLNIPPNLAKQLFGIEYLDLSSLRKDILDKAGLSSLIGKTNEEIYSSIDFNNLSDERQKAVKDGLEKQEDLERKAQEDRLKKYVKYLQKAQSEAVRIKIDELNQLAEIEKTFQLKENVATSKDFGMTKEQWSEYNKLVEAKKEINEENLKSIGLSDELIAKVIKYNNQMKISADLARKGVRKETEEKLNANQWKLFKESSPYKLAFSDIESQSTATLNIIEDGIKSIEDSLSKLDVTQMKELADLKQKVFDIKVSRNPFKALETSLNEIQKLKNKGLTKDTLLNQIVGSEGQIDKAQHTIDLIDIALNKGLRGASVVNAEDLEDYYVLLHKTKEDLHDLRTKQEGFITKNKEAKATAEQNLDTYAKADQAAKEAFAQAQQATEMMQKAYGDLSNILSAVGVEMEDSDDAIQNIGFGLLDLGMQIAQIAIQANIMGVAFQTAMGPIGWISMALSAVSTVLTGIFAAHDNSLERDIQNTIEYVEKLERAYQRLEKRIESAYSAGWINSNYADASQNIQSQINSYESMIAFEDEKKNTDQDKIREWKNEIEDLTEQLSELEQQRIEALGGFGSEANYKSAAEEFASAWFDAYREVGDGISGLEDTFDEFINNVVKKQLLIRGSQQLLQPLLEMIDNAVNDGMVTTTEMAGINKEWNDKTKDALNEYYKAIYDMYDGMIAGAGELSDLQRGIQNITEPQAAAIEAYLNSVRAFVSDSNTQLKNIYNAINVSTSTPIMSELRTQTELIRSINENIGSVIGRGRNGIEGAYIKVLAH